MMDKQLLSYEQTYTSWTDDIPTCRWKSPPFINSTQCTKIISTFIVTPQCHVVISANRKSSTSTLSSYQGVRCWLEWKRGLQNGWKSNPQRTSPVRGPQLPFQEGGVRSLSLRRLRRLLWRSSGRLCDEETACGTPARPASA